MRAMPQVIPKSKRPSPYSYSSGRREPSGKVPIVSFIIGKITKIFTREKWEETDEVIIEHDRAVSREIRRTTRTYTRETRSFFGD